MFQKGSAVVCALAGLIAANGCSNDKGAAKSEAKGTMTAKVKCEGVNECKGHGGCKSASHGCAGQNGCKGQGFVEMSGEDCQAKGGKPMGAEPAAAPGPRTEAPAAPAAPAAKADMAVAKVKCEGINQCKGHGACKGAGHDCAGKNGCKGQGWVEISASDCQSQGGKAL
jgi:hypothetical protein